MHVDAMYAVAHLRILIGDLTGSQPFVDRLPATATVGGPEGTSGRDGDVEPLWVGRMLQDRVQAHTAGAGLPLRAGVVVAQARKLGPLVTSVGGFKQSRVLDTGVERLGVVQRGLQMPDAGEVPGPQRAVIPLMLANLTVVAEVVAYCVP